MLEQTFKISAGTISRTIILLLALVNQCLGMAGFQVIPIEDEQINTVVSTIWTVAASVSAWWCNNSFTHAAIEGDKLIRAIKRKGSAGDGR